MSPPSAPENAATRPATDPPRARMRRALGWLALVLCFVYAGIVHQGLGSGPGGDTTRWWHPSAFMLYWESVGAWVDTPAVDIGLLELPATVVGILMLALPAAVLAALVFVGTHSAIARMLALSCLCAVALFTFYGLSARFVWSFFHWRGSLTMLLIALALGAALASPALAASWLRRHWLLMIGIYAPIFVVVVGLLRNATGTDESLAFNFSPWPAIAVFGLEIGAYAIAGVFIGLAFAAACMAPARRKTVGVAVGLMGGLALSIAWFYGRFDNAGPQPLVVLVPVTLLGIAVVAWQRRRATSEGILRPAGILATGAFLVCAPLLTGRAMANADYAANRFVRAERLNAALRDYYFQRDGYPDTLEELITTGYLDRIPQPRVGFDFLYDLGWLDRVAFQYQSLGSSYVLEFVSTEWMQCAYNPPWYDEEYEDEEAEEDVEAEEAWSCPDVRPDLW